MPTPLQPELDAIASVLTDPQRLVRAVAAGRRRATHPRWRRAELRPVELKAGPALQIVTYDERQAFTANHAYGPDAEAAVAALMTEPFGNWHVDTDTETITLRVTKKGDAQVHRAARPADGAAGDGARGPQPHDRQKARLLDASHPFLREVGVTDAQGRIKPSRQAKYRQVEDFLRQLAAVLPAAGAVPRGDEGGIDTAHRTDGDLHGERLRVVDLGCGNAYLSFGAYAYLTDVRGGEVELLGVDVKDQAREHNAGVAAHLGWDEHVRFAVGTIADAVPTFSDGSSSPDVVLALHACDTATDDALAQAIRWQAPVILAAPCCHHDLQKRLAAAPTPSPYGLVTRHGLLSERLADVLTDAFRAALLRLHGYRVEVVEFVDSAHTPRNAMLRAVRTGAAPTPELVREYDALCEQWGVTPYLAEVLADEPRHVLEVLDA